MYVRERIWIPLIYIYVYLIFKEYIYTHIWNVCESACGSPLFILFYPIFIIYPNTHITFMSKSAWEFAWPIYISTPYSKNTYIYTHEMYARAYLGPLRVHLCAISIIYTYKHMRCMSEGAFESSWSIYLYQLFIIFKGGFKCAFAHRYTASESPWSIYLSSAFAHMGWLRLRGSLKL